MLKDRLRAARKRIGKTQKAVAEDFGIDETTYCGYETGKREPDAVRLRKLALYFGVTGDYLLELDDNPTRKEEQLSLSEPEKELISTYNSLNDEGKKHLLIAADSYLKNSDLKEKDTQKAAT